MRKDTQIQYRFSKNWQFREKKYLRCSNSREYPNSISKSKQYFYHSAKKSSSNLLLFDSTSKQKIDIYGYNETEQVLATIKTKRQSNMWRQFWKITLVVIQINGSVKDHIMHHLHI